MSDFDLQTALDSGASLIDVPPGVSPITAQVNWPRHPVVMRGCGAGVSILEVGSLPIGIRAYGTEAEPIGGLHIADLTIRGGANDDTAPTELIEIGDYVSGVSFRDVELYWAKKAGVRFTAGVFGSGLLMDGCHVHDIATPQMTAINGGAVQGCLHQSTFRNCRFENTGQTGTHHGLYLSTSIPTPIEDITIEGCLFSGQNTRLSLYGGTRKRVHIRGNIFRVPSWMHVYGCEEAIVQGNIFYDGIPALASPGLLFQGNTIIRTSGFEGIAVNAPADRVAIIGNRFERRTTVGLCFISVYGGDKHLIKDNVFVNTTYSSGSALDVRVYGGVGTVQQGNVQL